ncbi:MAG: ERF family protein [Pseudomonadota bacterium]
MSAATDLVKQRAAEAVDRTGLMLLQRINNIRKAVTTVGKDADVDGKYTAVTHDAVNRMLRPLMAEHGVVDTISLEHSETVATGINWGKRELVQYRGTYCYTLYNADCFEDRLQIRVQGHADDNGDKAPGKALSYAQKSARLKVFSIETGEDDEIRVPEDKLTVAPLSPKHLAEIYAKAESLFGDDAESVLRSMAEKIFMIEDGNAALIPADQYQTAINALQNKHERDAA